MTKDLPQEDHPDDDAGLYVISVAAELSGLHPQTLRQYDRLGLVSPDRTVGRNRRYSLRDIASLRMVQRLVGEKVNGGFYGDQPSLKNLISGDLAVTTDFRDVYATLLEKVLRSPAEQTLGRWDGRTQFMKS